MDAELKHTSDVYGEGVVVGEFFAADAEGIELTNHRRLIKSTQSEIKRLSRRCGVRAGLIGLCKFVERQSERLAHADQSLTSKYYL
ncbi:MAG: hypothetical protein HDS87_07305 [Bacteroidales bacterium]|nr:hypothetical protein [Bacteroidales bacterium]